MEYAQVAYLEASLGQTFFLSMRAWLAKKLFFMKLLGGPIIDTAQISMAEDLIGELSNLSKLSTKYFVSLIDS